MKKSILALHLQDWRTLNKILTKLREDQVLAMLHIEQADLARPRILERLHQRYGALRTARERAEILGSAKI